MLSAVFIGEQTLLIQCAEHWLERGNLLSLVVTENDTIINWCDEKDIDFIGPDNDLLVALSDISFHYLFSITNLKILPRPVLELAGVMAINFHDGPLPGYAGLNVPAWAILNGEQNHGVTFHEMTTTIDAGDILKRKIFPVVSDETAFTLNAKCYQMAREAFEELVADLMEDALQRLPQSATENQYFQLGKKPDAAALLDFTGSDKSLSRLIRAMDYGAYNCPLSYPKLWLGSSWVVVKAVELVDQKTAAAGVIQELSSDGLVVSCDEGAVKLSAFLDLSGQHLCPLALMQQHGFEVGSELPQLSVATRQRITDMDKDVGRYENYWIKRLVGTEILSLTYRSAHTGSSATEYVFSRQVLPAYCHEILSGHADAGDTLLCLLGLYLTKIAGKQSFDLPYVSKTLGELPAELADFFSSTSLFRIEWSASENIDTFLENSKQCLNEISERGTFSRDLYLRIPALHHVQRGEHREVAAQRVATIPAEQAISPLRNALVLQIPDDGLSLCWAYQSAEFSSQAIEKMQEQFVCLLESIVKNNHVPIAQLNILSENDRQRLLVDWNATERQLPDVKSVHSLIEQTVVSVPDSVALVFENQEVSYRELNAKANQLARYLREKGAGPGKVVGVLVDRSLDMIVSLLAVLKSGSAYVPLDPVYPQERLAYMVSDAELSIVICNDALAQLLPSSSAALISLEQDKRHYCTFAQTDLSVEVNPSDLAYIIYTSGSTGNPKGVMVEHGNVLNFFVGMDACIDGHSGVWLAVTSISFDISVLEIFWTLARGFKVVLYADERRQKSALHKARSRMPEKDIDFSLFYWNVAGEESDHIPDKYRLLLDGAKFADKHGFKAVWNPERHFASFGGLFPNPSVTCAALATITEHVELRAGSCVVPLHSPIRVAEEWSVVDNISNGRVGIAIASGWAPPDFAIKPENFANAKEVMFESLATLKKLWRGETVSFPGPNGEVAVRTLPRPIQKELPTWVTTAGNVDSFRQAARQGCNVLTHLLGQTVQEVGEKIRVYREEWRAAGHAGDGKITLMLHTFVGTDKAAVEDIVREPLKNYLKSAMFLVKGAAWNFPTFKKMSDETGKTLDEFFENISDEDMNDLLEFAFQRYFHSSGLFGTPENCLEMVDQCKAINVDEIACLIDFGIDTDTVLAHLPYLDQVRAAGAVQQTSEVEQENDYSIPALMARHAVTHFQCTPSMAQMLVAESVSRKQIAQLQNMLIGGEAFPPELAVDLFELVQGKVINMYGPTEATVWSSSYSLAGADGAVSIGRPIANTRIYIVDENLQLLPVGVPGELLIAGRGVARGYYRRLELSAEKFIPDPFSDNKNALLYRTGDLARFEEDGSISYLGRIDQQVKIRGYRVELGEIEALLTADADIREAVVVLREDVPGDKRLVAYLKMRPGQVLESEVLKRYLSEHLPDFMVPVNYVEVKALPLTPNGKVDRRALPAPQTERRKSTGEIVKPANASETLLQDIWQRALGIAEVSTRDNFFDIGGHSLLVVQVLKELRDHEEIQKHIQMSDMFRYPTIEALAKFIAADSEDNSVLEVGQARAVSRKTAMGRRRRSKVV